MNTNLIKAENLRYTVRKIVNATNILKTTIHNYLIRMKYVNRCKVWIPQSLTEIDFMNHISTCDFLPSPTTWKRSFFKEACHLETRLEFCIKMCNENALDLRIVDVQLLRGAWTSSEESSFIHLVELGRCSLLWTFSR